MLKKIIILFFLFNNILLAHAHNDTIYYNCLDEVVDQKVATYFTVSDSISLKINAYYLTGNPKFSIDVVSFTPIIKHGFATYYYPNGGINIEGMYAENNKEDMWVYRSPDGGIWYESFYKNNLHDGILKVYYKNGQVKREANYIQDKIISEKCYAENQQEDSCNTFETLPLMSINDSIKVKTLLDNKKIKELSIKVCVGEDGKLKSFKILTPLNKKEQFIITDLIKDLFDWTAATIDGDAIESIRIFSFN